MADRQWTSSIPQIASEDVIALGNGRYAHFRRDRRFAQVQVVFTAPDGVDPNPGRELTDQFKEIGWRWRSQEPGQPWIFQLQQSSPDDPTARGDNHDALHEQFVNIVQEYRQKRGLPPTSGWQSLFASDPKSPNIALGIARETAAGDIADRAREKQKPPSAKRETRAGAKAGAPPALAMLDAFASVGAAWFDLTLTDAAGEKVAFRGDRNIEQLRQALPAILQGAEAKRHNVIVRPRSAGPALIQLDDLGAAGLEALRPVSFLSVCTSPDNYQVWVAVADADEDFARRLKQGAGADPTASGAVRISGSLNVKEQYAPAFPRVETVHVTPGLVVSRAEVEAIGVVAVAEKTDTAPASCPRQHPGGRGWPSYQRCLEGAPEKDDGRRDRSRADYTFCRIALDWGWSAEDIAARLLQVSDKARENGEKYAMLTVQKAAAGLRQR